MKSGSLVARSDGLIRALSWISALLVAANAQAELPLASPTDPPAECRGVTTEPPQACLRVPKAAQEQAPAAQTDGEAPPSKAIICACLSIEDIEPVDAIVLRGRRVRATA